MHPRPAADNTAASTESLTGKDICPLSSVYLVGFSIYCFGYSLATYLPPV